MAKSPVPLQPPSISSESEIRAAVRKLARRIEDLEKFDPQKVGSRNDPQIDVLEASIAETLESIFGPETSAYHRYRPAAQLDTARHSLNGTSLNAVVNGLIHGKARSSALLKQAIRFFDERLEDEFPVAEIRSNFHSSAAGNAMAGAAIVGFSGVEGRGEAGNIRAFNNKNAVFGFAEAALTSDIAFDNLMARVAVLEAALAAPKPRAILPIGPGHNGPPEFEPPFEEQEIRQFIDLLKAQKATARPDLPKLVEATNAAEARVSKLKTHIDDFATAAVKGAGAEAGKRLVQLPFWLAVSTSLQAVVHALEIWISAVIR